MARKKAESTESKPEQRERFKRIELTDTYTLNIDRYNYWITEKRVSEKSGKEWNNAYCGFWSTLEDCLLAFLHKSRALDESERDTIKHLIAHDKQVRSEIKGFAKTVIEKCGDMRKTV